VSFLQVIVPVSTTKALIKMSVLLITFVCSIALNDSTISKQNNKISIPAQYQMLFMLPFLV